MIPLGKKLEHRERYREWFQENEEKLMEDFSGYRDKKKKDWISQTNREQIQEILFRTSHEKCSYCERKPNKGGGYIEIEHFYPKKDYPDKVFDFDNLLPSCKQCNTAKSGKDGSEILNPYNESSITPHLALDMKTMALKGISPKGKATVSALEASLNTKKFFKEGEIEQGALPERQNIQLTIEKKLDAIEKTKEEHIFSQLKGLLEIIDEKEVLTATYATVILNHTGFNQFMTSFEKNEVQKYNELNTLVKEKSRFCLSIC